MLPHVRISTLSALAMLIGLPGPSSAADNGTVRIEWRVPRGQVADVRTRLRLNGSITPDESTAGDTKGLPLIYVFAGIVSLPYLADALVAAVRDVACGGVVIDDIGAELKIACDRRLDGGTVVVRSSKGVEVQRVEEMKDPSTLLGALAKLRGVP